jgi:hypothetical protein
MNRDASDDRESGGRLRGELACARAILDEVESILSTTDQPSAATRRAMAAQVAEELARLARSIGRSATASEREESSLAAGPT